ncbi:MAG TPA: PAS domain S-box protein [Flavisolibacter sp.]|nr:PAS domain S-box protein [Flavisolibacter sp.]
MKLNLEQKLFFFLSLTLLIIIFLFWSGYKSKEEHLEMMGLVEHTEKVLLQAEKVLSLNQDIENNQRGYILTGDNRLLTHFNSTVHAVIPSIQELRELTADNPSQQRRIDSLIRYTNLKIDYSRLVINTYQREGFEAAQKILARAEGIQLMGAIRKELESIQNEEFRLLSEIKEQAVKSNQSSEWSILYQLLFIVIIFLVFALIIYRNLQAGKRAAETIRSNEEQLKTIIETGNNAFVLINSSGAIIDWNTQSEKIFGWKKEEVMGRSVAEIIIPVQYRTEYEKKLNNTFKTGKGTLIGKRLELSALHRSGNEFDVEFTIASIKRGNSYIFAVFLHDITQRKATEKELVMLASVVNHSDDAIYTNTLDGVITSWNKGAEKVYGYTAEEAIGQIVPMLIPHHRKNEEAEIVCRILRGEIIDHYETERIRKDGQILNISLTVSPIKDDSGKITGVSKIARDITINKKAEEELFKLASIVNHSDDAIYSNTLDDLIITSWNKGAEKVYGYTAEEAIGQTVPMLIPPHRSNEEQEIVSRILHGEIIDHYETERIRKDGQILNISLTVSPIKDANGKIIGVSKIARDITIHKKAEEELFKLASIVNHSDDAIYSNTLDGLIITSWNKGAEKIYGYTAEEAIGQTVPMLIPPHRSNEEQEIVSRILHGEIVDHFETERISKNGELLSMSLTVSPIKDDSGKITGVSKIARNITEKKKIEEELQIVVKELESFTYSVSHDLRAPLRIINGYADIITNEYGEGLDEDVKKMLTTIASNVKRMGRLIDDLLEFSRLGRKEPTVHETDMNAIVQNVLNEQLKIFGSKTYKVTSGNLERCFCDSSLIKNVWQNLISNALKYSSKVEDPKIEIGCHKRKTETVYYIKDNGAGFNMEYYNKLFGVFQRLHKVSEYEGTGVGLALSQRIVLKHGGRIWAESEEGKGSTFYFSIPASKTT